MDPMGRRASSNATRMATHELIGSDSTAFGRGETGVTRRQLQRGGSGGGQIPRARFVGGGVGGGQTQVHAHRFRQWRIVMGAHPNGGYAIGSQMQCQVNRFGGAARIEINSATSWDQSVRGRHALLRKDAKT